MSNVYVGNISWSMTSEELKAFVEGESAPGSILSVELQHHKDTGRSKGWGLVTIAKEHASDFIRRVDGKFVNNRRIHVRFDYTVAPQMLSSGTCLDFISVYMGNIPWNFNTDTLESLLSEYNPAHVQIMTKTSGLSRGFAILKFNNIEDAQKCIDAFHGIEMEKRRIECRFDRGLNTRETPSADSSLPTTASLVPPPI